jgi:hypothetical protein
LTEIKLDKRYDGEFQFATIYLTQNIYRYAKGGRRGAIHRDDAEDLIAKIQKSL